MAVHADNSKGHSIPSKVYLRVGAALLILTAITVAVAQIPLGGFNLVVAMIIATAKATLVALFFMHLKYDNRLYLLIFVIALATLAVFIILTLFDTLNRGRILPEVAAPIRSEAVIYPLDSARSGAIPTEDTSSGSNAPEH